MAVRSVSAEHRCGCAQCRECGFGDRGDQDQLCVNAAVEPPKLHVAFNSTAGLSRREFIEAFVPTKGGQPGFRQVDRYGQPVCLRPGRLRQPGGAAPVPRAGAVPVALRYWTTGSRVLVLAHLYIAGEALTKATQRMHQARLGLTEEQHAQLLGVDTTKPKWEMTAQNFARREYIFEDDKQVDHAAKSRPVNEFEYIGTADLGNVRQTRGNLATRPVSTRFAPPSSNPSGTGPAALQMLIMSRQPGRRLTAAQAGSPATSSAIPPSDPGRTSAMAGGLFPTLCAGNRAYSLFQVRGRQVRLPARKRQSRSSSPRDS